METPEKQFNPKESLLLIQEMITVTRRRIDKESFLILLWGYLATSWYLLGFLWMKLEKYTYVAYSWALLCGLGIIVSLIYWRSKSKTDRIKTYVDDCIKYTWIGYLITMLIIVSALIKFQCFYLINPLGLIIVGLPTIITGGVIRFKPLLVGGILFWIFGAIAFTTTFDWQCIIGAVAIVCGYLIPGYMLKASTKNETI